MNTVYFAKHILLETGETLLNGAVSVRGGVIADVGPRGMIKRSGNDRLVNLGDILLLPGLINMHTHLEESPIRSFRKEYDETFTAWSGKKYSRMEQLTTEQIGRGIRLCVRELLSHGVTTVVDSTRTGISASVLADEPIRSVIIMEVADDQFLEDDINRVRQWMEAGPAFKYGIGPHALYSLEPRHHRKLIEYCNDSGCLWSCHIAESAEELQAFCELNGEFFLNLTQKKPWPAGSARYTPVQFALAEGLLPSRAILFHCNYAAGYELALLAAKRAFFTLCPNYGAETSHKSFPIEVARERGFQICLGTEGMTPAGQMNLFDDLFRLKTAYPHIGAAEMLSWVTKNPAAALRASDKLGTISPGKHADIIGVRFPYNDGDDILETLLLSDHEISFVMVGGEVIIADR
ncbi:MAG: amidohydrolase family protein [Chitinispirillales bacterium]|jgi:5-methylthioadenosine/S-adenosylhomocysteine deaminase|nr:amidohydrolase family protein [Chitinispirillales bacterium]